MSTQQTDDLIGQRQQRIDIIHKFRDQGIDPYPARSQKDATNQSIHNKFDDYCGKKLNLAGRIMNIRRHGKIIFYDIQDESGSIQICVKKDTYSPSVEVHNGLKALTWENLSFLDIGDFAQIMGDVGKTQSEQITLFAESLYLLSKSVRPLPNTLLDKEHKFRRRYLDLTLHPDEKARFIRKAKFWKVTRDYLASHGFIEVETPVLEHVTGGADARPFVTHHNELDQDFYLRISTELYQKRLIGAGFERIYTFGPNFRNEGLSDEHLQEYYQIEWYWAYASYEDNMKLTQDMFRHIAQEVYGKTKFTSRGHTFDLADEWKKIDYVKIIHDTFGVDIFTSPETDMQKTLNEKGIELTGIVNRSRLIDNLWKLIRKTISGPAFLINEPAFLSPLSKSRTDDPRITERYHVLIGGSELANGYSEINDPAEQLSRFLDQQKMREQGDDEAQMLDIDYVEMLEYGMPPTSGHGHSERLFWFLEDCTGREGTLFPLLRRDFDQHTLKIYPFLKSPEKIEEDVVITAQTISTNMSTSSLPFSRAQAVDLVNEHISNVGLRKHCLAVGAAMVALYDHFHPSSGKVSTVLRQAQDDLADGRGLWEIIGLLHDADWEETKDAIDQHTRKTVQWVTDLAGDREPETTAIIVRTILSHNYHNNGEPEPSNTREWALSCCDELTGIIVANALIMPSKKLADISPESVIKKMNTRSFAAAVDRTGIVLCEEKLGMKLYDFVSVVLHGMQSASDELGL